MDGKMRGVFIFNTTLSFRYHLSSPIEFVNLRCEVARPTAAGAPVGELAGKSVAAPPREFRRRSRIEPRIGLYRRHYR